MGRGSRLSSEQRRPRENKSLQPASPYSDKSRKKGGGPILRSAAKVGTRQREEVRALEFSEYMRRGWPYFRSAREINRRAMPRRSDRLSTTNGWQTSASTPKRGSSRHPPHAALKRREQRLSYVRGRRFASPLEGQASLALYQWRNSMTKLNLLSAALIAAAMIATPAMARQSHITSRRDAENTFAASDAGCVRAPRVGAFATQPWTNPPCEPTSGY
jgi:hypothetical protein